ncbi:MAG: hypothetical protein DRO95_06315 [Candidatus Altiarchaeales archaeon]|nr:MAG: hypothetical protein DRO95_06315 [Candidatus Altiarchaeales archaeon]HDO82106.1 DUF72 domain-containing protein [Candidatus Altiarchaeales archaeon]HEX54755.1 DUF72 domain-containing protein [Candidatus Altiarchaeales archaeon]
MINTRIGCCGWSSLRLNSDWRRKYKSKLQAYSELFSIVEINSTFYKLPRISTCKKWRDEADLIDEKFEFTIKANQIITHKDRFKSKTSVETFEKIKEICDVLRARIVLIQTPASFKPSEENLKNAERFFERIEDKNLRLVWEVRGREWSDEIVERLFKKFNIVHCVDPFLRKPCCGEFLYFRLHGSPPGERMYYYRYTNKDLTWLSKILRGYDKFSYVLFNNIWMCESALKFMKILENEL